ncbi:hypothetical protein [Acidovorax sp. PRC11]|uniref:hypothetical protein n=1 Tax=Acidovorax sp. PRC11 TaxID=2962592 RepID=UPI0028827E66|nr:hypothetical protein [Acidovorax sp. PRC11]MDT0138805.1 hypothetical protein [Acidovorax sp. PRC11]
MGNACTGGIASTSALPSRSRTAGRIQETPPQRGSNADPGRGGLLGGLRSRRASRPDSGAGLRQAHRQVNDLLARASNHPDRHAEEAALHRLEGQIAQALREGTSLPHLDAELQYLDWRMQGVEPLQQQEAVPQPARYLPSPGPDLDTMSAGETRSDADSDGESVESDRASIDSDGNAQMRLRMHAAHWLAR